MKRESWKWLFTWEGRVQRVPYLLAGTTLTIMKFVIDRSVAAHYGESWRIWNYFLPALDVSISGLGLRQPRLYAILWAVAILFFWVGIALTLRRLRDAGLQAGWIFLFFVPVVNLTLFLCLSFVPTSLKPTAEADDVANRELQSVAKNISKPRTEVFGVLIAVALRLGPIPGHSVLNRIHCLVVPERKSNTLRASDDRDQRTHALPDRCCFAEPGTRRFRVLTNGRSAGAPVFDCRRPRSPVHLAMPPSTYCAAALRRLCGCPAAHADDVHRACH
jgi:uncharacterized membrane protein YhaH (DUF805 family)